MKIYPKDRWIRYDNLRIFWQKITITAQNFGLFTQAHRSLNSRRNPGNSLPEERSSPQGLGKTADCKIHLDKFKLSDYIQVYMIDTPTFELVEISSPYGKTIQCAKQGNVLIPLTKITKFGLGRIQFPEQAELSKLRQERHGNQRKFSGNREKLRHLERLERLGYNWLRSQGNLKAVRDAGFRDSEEVERKLIEHLLTVGQSVAGASYQFSETDAPLERLHIQSYWQALNDGRNYLTTVIFTSDRNRK